MNVSGVDVAAAAVVLPPLVSLIKQRHWSPQVKALIALGVFVVYSSASTLITAGLDLGHWRDTLLTVSGSALAAYHLYWGPSGYSEAIETATSVSAPAADTFSAPASGSLDPAATVSAVDTSGAADSAATSSGTAS